MVLPVLRILLETTVTSDELSFVTSVSLIHMEIPLYLTSSIPLKRDSLLIWGISPCSSTGGEEQLVKSDNFSTPEVLSGSDWFCSNSCWMWKESSHSPSVNRSGEHLWSKAIANDEGRCWCWLTSAWTWLWLPLLADWAEDEDSADAEGWLVVFCWLLLPRWQPPIRASTCRRS